VDCSCSVQVTKSRFKVDYMVMVLCCFDYNSLPYNLLFGEQLDYFLDNYYNHLGSKQGLSSIIAYYLH
jgi:hypothetical protein